jgi:hypothetical protein
MVMQQVMTRSCMNADTLTEVVRIVFSGGTPWMDRAVRTRAVQFRSGGSVDMLVLIRWQGRKVAVPLSQLAAIDPDESTDEAIGDWHYWIVQGYIL